MVRLEQLKYFDVRKYMVFGIQNDLRQFDTIFDTIRSRFCVRLHTSVRSELNQLRLRHLVCSTSRAQVLVACQVIPDVLYTAFCIVSVSLPCRTLFHR
jgi:hypothetical protein